MYKRNTRRKHVPANDVPWQMFVKGIYNALDNYGDYTYYATDARAIPIGELVPRIQELADVGTAQKSLLVPIEITAERTVNGMQMDVNTISSVYEKSVKNLVAEAIAQKNSGDIGVYYA